MEEKGTEYLTGIEAINKFNEKFNQGNFNLPKDLNRDIFSVHLFSFTDVNNCEIMITIIGIHIKKLTDTYYKNNCDIPNKDFIISTCRFHNSYEHSVYQDDDIKYDKNVKNIIESALTPKGDVLESIIENPDFINSEKKLYNYQKRSIKWMYETEIKKKKIYYSINSNSEIEMGPFVFDTTQKQLLVKNTQKYLEFRGGALIDEVGLGKTIQILTLCLLNPVLVNELSYIDLISV